MALPAHPDTTYRPRTRPKKRTFVEQAVSDIKTGFPELQRQMGVAAEKIKGGYRKIKKFVGG